MSEAELLNVTAAIIEDKGRILIARRKPEKALGGKWEFPGGKVRRGEKPEECIKREIKEELGLEIEIEGLFCENIHKYPAGTIKLITFKARKMRGHIFLQDHDRIAWVKPEELMDYDFAPADIPVAQKIVENHRNLPPKETN